MQRIAFVAFVWLATCVSADDASFPWLHTLDAGDGVSESGLQLVGLPHGLHALEAEEPEAKELLIGVHGMRSGGYEWVYPLQTMNSAARHVYFFNWESTAQQCPIEVAETLLAEINGELGSHSNIEAVIVVGHSLGGMVVSQLAAAWDGNVPLTIHAIAAPLAYIEMNEEEACPMRLPKAGRTDVRFFQWRTRFELDNAFNRLDFNPMEVDIPDSVVVVLPETYRDRRLGHNWSISYVAERIAAEGEAE